jgi:hypothetical protein
MTERRATGIAQPLWLDRRRDGVARAAAGAVWT